MAALNSFPKISYWALVRIRRTTRKNTRCKLVVTGSDAFRRRPSFLSSVSFCLSLTVLTVPIFLARAKFGHLGRISPC